MRRKYFLTVLAALTAALAAASSACSPGRSIDSDDASESFTLDLNDPALKERLAADDGYSFAVFYGGDIHGSLETCG